MGRPLGSDQQRLYTYQLYKQGFKPTPIRNALKLKVEAGEFGEHEVLVHLNTVNNWIRNFIAIDTGLDSPFQWHRLEEYGLPWEASDFLLQAWREATSGTASNLTDFQHLPTVREMRWYWRTHQAAPDLPFLADGDDIFDIARRYVFREICHEILGESLYMDDLDALVASKRWVSPEHTRTYDNAVEGGKLPKLRGNVAELTRRIRSKLQDRGTNEREELP